MGAHYQSVLTLVGDRGCGKTAVVANWIKAFSEENPSITVFSHYVGSSCVSVDVGHLLRRCAKEVRGDFTPPGSSECKYMFIRSKTERVEGRFTPGDFSAFTR